MGQIQQIISKARSYLGSSGGETFWRDYGLTYRVPWCMIFVWYVFQACGLSRLLYDGRKIAYVPTLDTWARDMQLIVTDPQPGDLIIYDWNANDIADHIGICTGSTATTITTIEGNADDTVKELTRQRAQVLRIIRPAYDPEPSQQAGDYVTRTELRAWLQELLTKI